MDFLRRFTHSSAFRKIQVRNLSAVVLSPCTLAFFFRFVGTNEKTKKSDHTHLRLDDFVENVLQKKRIEFEFHLTMCIAPLCQTHNAQAIVRSSALQIIACICSQEKKHHLYIVTNQTVMLR